MFQGSIFSFLSSIFKKYDVSTVLVGGYALIANKVQRMTFDIDFIITVDDLKKIEKELISSGYFVVNRQDAFVQFKSELPGYKDLDFLIADFSTIEKLKVRGKQISIAGNSFIVPAPIHLVAMKLHSISGNSARELKDFPDIVQLLDLPELQEQKEEVYELFAKYNLIHLLKRIVKLSEEK